MRRKSYVWGCGGRKWAAGWTVGLEKCGGEGLEKRARSSGPGEKQTGIPVSWDSRGRGQGACGGHTGTAKIPGAYICLVF